MTDSIIIKRLLALVEKYGSQKAAAEHLGVSPQYLHDILAGLREPGPKILSALGYERVIRYQKTEATHG